MDRPGLKQFRSEGCLSYLLFDRSSRLAIVIDPRIDLLDDYRSFISENGLKPVLALDTHIHADHFSGTHLFKEVYGSEIVMSARTESARPGRRVRTGDRIEAGALGLEVLETPGHTPDSVSFAGHGLVFTGDTLFIGSSGRTDFPGADPDAQWDSIHRVLGALPNETLILPGHDYSDLIFSTLEIEKKTNPHWKPEDKGGFVALKRAELIPNPSDEIRARVQFNQAVSPPPPRDTYNRSATACGTPAAGADRGTASISVEKYAPKLQERATGHLFIDVREPDEFQEGHMPGARNIPLSEVGLHLGELRKASRVYLSCLSGRRSGVAAKTLSYLGLPDVVNVSGGIKAWQNAGLPVHKPVQK